MKTALISDKIVKWFFIIIIFSFVVIAAAYFLTDAETRSDSAEAAAKSTEELRLK